MTQATPGLDALLQCYVLLWTMAGLVNLHACVGRSRHSHRAWSPIYALCIIARMMCDVLFAQHALYVHVLSACMLFELAMLWHLTAAPRRHSYPVPGAIGHTTVQLMVVCADAVLMSYMYALETPMLGRVRA